MLKGVFNKALLNSSNDQLCHGACLMMKINTKISKSLNFGDFFSKTNSYVGGLEPFFFFYQMRHSDESLSVSEITQESPNYFKSISCK